MAAQPGFLALTLTLHLRYHAGRTVDTEKNIVLIGMPGVGKSTVGVLLAKRLARHFVDTDVMIQAAEKGRLQDIIDMDGLGAFRRLEQRQVLSLQCRAHVIATGGSVVYSRRAMEHLADAGVIVHLVLPLDALRKRLTDLDSRGVVMARGETLEELYAERMPLYRRWAESTVSCDARSHEEVVDAIVEGVGA